LLFLRLFFAPTLSYIKMTRFLVFIIFSSSLIAFSGCESAPNTPLPRAYFRIALPEKDYRDFDTIFPYRFEYPVYAVVTPDQRKDAEPWWADVHFPEFKAVLHLSYKSVTHPDQLNEFAEDGRNFVNRHIPKASAFMERVYTNPENRVHGVLFEIKGKEAATPLQFYLTDSTRHFLRGSLYFNVTPNNDSLAPVIDFLKQDILLLVESLEWTR
jgi:gliding motility-associated lipoprotein GldD